MQLTLLGHRQSIERASYDTRSGRKSRDVSRIALCLQPLQWNETHGRFPVAHVNMLQDHLCFSCCLSLTPE